MLTPEISCFDNLFLSDLNTLRTSNVYFSTRTCSQQPNKS